MTSEERKNLFLEFTENPTLYMSTHDSIPKLDIFLSGILYYASQDSDFSTLSIGEKGYEMFNLVKTIFSDKTNVNNFLNSCKEIIINECGLDFYENLIKSDDFEEAIKISDKYDIFIYEMEFLFHLLFAYAYTDSSLSDGIIGKHGYNANMWVLSLINLFPDVVVSYLYDRLESFNI